MKNKKIEFTDTEREKLQKWLTLIASDYKMRSDASRIDKNGNDEFVELYRFYSNLAKKFMNV